jgi:hypothetical protein
VTISSINFSIDSNYYGYIDSEYISPTLIQNYVTNYNFKGNSGWTATQNFEISSDTKPSTEGVYGRFIEDEGFRSVVDDYLKGEYSDNNPYKSYMKLEFKQVGQFVLNSGIKDNRTSIKNMPKNEEWVLDYKIVNSSNEPVNNIEFSFKEFVYDKESGGYRERASSLSIGELSSDMSSPIKRKIFKVKSNNYTEEDFKNSKIYLQIKPQVPASVSYPLVYYIEHMALYRKSLDKNGNIIVPDYDNAESGAAQDYVDNSTI